MPYDSVSTYMDKTNKLILENDSLGNSVLLPYDPQETSLGDRLKSLGKSLGGQPLVWLIGIL